MALGRTEFDPYKSCVLLTARGIRCKLQRLLWLQTAGIELAQGKAKESARRGALTVPTNTLEPPCLLS